MQNNWRLFVLLLSVSIVQIPLAYSKKSCKRHQTTDEIEKDFDLLIIGSGVAGLTSGIQASRAKLNTLIIEGKMCGGQLAYVPLIENWPGETSISGCQLMEKLHCHAQKFGCQFIEETVTKVDFSSQPFKIWTNEDNEFTAKTIIIATGATPKRLHVPGEEDLWGKGIAVCSRCDGPLFANKRVVVIGGGNTAMHEAINLLKYTKKITMITTTDRLYGSEKMQARVKENKNIKTLYNTAVEKFSSKNNETLTHLNLKNLKTGKKSELRADGAFVAIGLKPTTSLFGELERDKKGYIIVKKGTTKTSIDGVYCAGVAGDKAYQQAAVSAGMGCMAAIDAERHLAKLSSNLT